MVEVFEKGAVKINDAFNIGRSVDANRKQIRDMISTTRAAIREIEQDYRDMMAVAEQMGGPDKLSKEGQEWLSNLKDAIKEAKAQLAGLQDKLQNENYLRGGFISGLTNGIQGLMGAYTAASGVLARFNADEEKLVAIQTKLQSSMSILMGLQQVYNTLQSTSSFRLQVVSRLTDLYAKAQARLAAATGAAKLAMGAWVAVIAAAVAGMAVLITRAAKHRKEVEDTNKAINATAQSVAGQLTAYRQLQIEWEKANGSLEAQNKLLKDSKWDELGLAVKDVNDAEKALVTNSSDVVQSFVLKAKAAYLYAQAQESIEKAAKKDLQADKLQKQKDEGNYNFWDRTRATVMAPFSPYDNAREKIMDDLAQKRINRLRQQSEESMEVGDDILTQISNLTTDAENLVEDFVEDTNNNVSGGAKAMADNVEREIKDLRQKISNARESLDDYEADFSVSIIEDEAERSLAALKLAHERKIEELEREKDELEAAFLQLNILETGNPQAGLTEEQSAELERFGDYIRRVGEEFAKEEAQQAAKTFNDLLVQYRGFGAKYVAETAEYERKRAELIKGTTDENKEEVEDALDELEREYQKTLAELGQDLANSGKDIDFSKWVDQLADMSLMDLQIELQTKTDDLELLNELFPEETEQVAELRAQIAMLNAAIKAYKEEKTEATDTDKWTDLAQVIDICRKSITELGQRIGGAFGEAIESIGETIGSISQLINASEELKKNPESLTAKFAVATSAIEGVASIVGNVIKSVKASEEATKAWADTIRECAHEYALLNIESKMYERRNIFGVENPYQKAIDSAKAYAEAIGVLQEKQNELYAGQVQTGTKKVTDWEAVGKNASAGAGAGAAIGTALGGWAMGLGTLIGGAIGAVVGGVSGLFTKKVVPIMDSLTSQYGQLFDANTYELNPALLADYDKLDEDTKKVIDNWDEIVQKTEEAKNAMKENFSSLAGDIGSQLSDALVNAFTDGDVYAAVDDFHQYTTEAIQNIIEQMIFSQAFGDLFDELEGKFNESFLGANADQNLVDDLIWFSEQYKKRLEDYNTMMTDAQDALGDLGFDLWQKPEEKREATRRSSLGASQDSIDESNGRLTAIQGHTFAIMNDVALIRSQNEELRLRTSELLAEVMGIHQDTTYMGTLLDEMNGYVREVRSGVNIILDKGVTVQ